MFKSFAVLCHTSTYLNVYPHQSNELKNSLNAIKSEDAEEVGLQFLAYLLG